MLYYDITDISERTDNTKSNRNKECIICHYWFFNHGFKFQDSVYYGCLDLTIIYRLMTTNNVISLGDSFYPFSNYSAEYNSKGISLGFF